ncbi:hypothetical protein [Halomonas sp. HAL1]|uniref:hypothetical protein n=1 Tax=Halomonas sp. HAL1 TaxID=550984 RepID=UPI00022D2C2D|nr:hypothetical protein [Halomonas sp. HAL1]EHA17147.1 hypothetical protein HAL1_03097 [Halomonas sp. HAL1]WKV92870.1 hypothetical protein Q3Y66_18820 [Halomonas sp. HAL1]
MKDIIKNIERLSLRVIHIEPQAVYIKDELTGEHTLPCDVQAFKEAPEALESSGLDEWAMEALEVLRKAEDADFDPVQEPTTRDEMYFLEIKMYAKEQIAEQLEDW